MSVRLVRALVCLCALAAATARVCDPPQYGELRVLNNAGLQQLEGCVVFTGTLYIGTASLQSLEDSSYNWDIVSLEVLSNLTHVMGSLELRYLRNLTHVDGLRNLKRIEYDLKIVDTGLVDIDGLGGSLEYVGDEVSINFNRALVQVDGLVYLSIIGSDISIHNNDALINIDGFWFNTYISTEVNVYDNYALCNTHFKEWSDKFKTFTHIEANADEKKCGPRLPPSVAAPPVVLDVGRRNATLTWPKLDNSHGLIVAYEIVATELHNGRVTNHGYMNYTLPPPINSTFFHSITGLRPYTNYTFAIASFDYAGSTIGNETGVYLTEEDVPEAVSSPVVSWVSARLANLTWAPPIFPNGVITSYALRVTAKDPWDPLVTRVLTRTAGPDDRGLQLDGLYPDTDYQAVLTASTSVGSADSNVTLFTTHPGAPDFHPDCISFGLQGLYTALVRWAGCVKANDRMGVQRYEVFINGTLVYRGAMPYFLADDLIVPGEPQAFVVVAYNRVSFGRSEPAILVTPPSPPTDVPHPSVSVINATALLVTWLPPVHPNGIIRLYEVRMDGVVVCSTPAQSCAVGGLVPSRTYSFVVVAFNSIGSGSSTALLATMPAGGFMNTGVSGGVIAGAVLGAAGFMVLVFAVCVWRKRREHRLALEAYRRQRNSRARRRKEEIECTEMTTRPGSDGVGSKDGVSLAAVDQNNTWVDDDDRQGLV